MRSMRIPRPQGFGSSRNLPEIGLSRMEEGLSGLGTRLVSRELSSEGGQLPSWFGMQIGKQLRPLKVNRQAAKIPSGK
eukprot:746480-Rhodomonas_salina.1